MEAVAGSGDWTTLFEGESVKAWPKHGGAATYRVEDGTIVGTNETFGDFELEFETMVNDSLNSGVQIRSHVRAEDDRVISTIVFEREAFEEGPQAVSPLVQRIRQEGVAA